MSGTLFVVATPIGNLEDITLRALRVLREADVIAAEDTRRTAKLLAHYAISTPSISFHRHNTRARLPQLVARLERGECVALVADAGMPGLSDPGAELVRACHDGGIAVDPVPGANAPLTAAVASGFPLEPLTIFGFVPPRGKERASWLEKARGITHTFTFFEAPHRIRRTISDLADLLGERHILVSRELTKVHQEFVRGASADVLGHITTDRGEFTVVVGPQVRTEEAENRAHAIDIYHDFCRSTDNVAGGRRRLVSALARKYGRSTREVYGIIERLKDSGV